MVSVKELQAQIVDLQQQIAEITQRERAEAISKIRELMKDHGLSVEDLAGGSAKRGRAAVGGGTMGSRVAPKYRDPVTGKEWAGRGIAPSWIRDKNRDEFLIKS